MIKKLQNNFTTPEQSKRLLELGVPAWTADCYYYEEGGISKDSTPNIISFGEAWTDESMETMFSSYIDIPSWSVGRLIEIYSLCVTCDPNVRSPMLCSGNNTELFVGMLEFAKDVNVLDFSKLEE